MWLLGAECAAAAARCVRRGRQRVGLRKRHAARATLAVRCGAARPVTLERLRTPSPLTARERQIARLAAEGHTTRQISDQLHVSVRTVDSHLAHVYSKLGVDGRHVASRSPSAGPNPRKNRRGPALPHDRGPENQSAHPLTTSTGEMTRTDVTRRFR